MGVPKLRTEVTVEEYLTREKISPVKHEYVYGEVYAMAGNSDNHNRIASNFLLALVTHLRGSCCEPFFADIKVRINPFVYYYPDILVSCEQEVADPHFRNEPILIIEVLSDSTEQIDRREKLAFYRQIPTLQEYVIVAQKRMLVEIHRRQPDGRWLTHFYNQADEEFEFTSVGLTMTVSEVYQRVIFDKSA